MICFHPKATHLVTSGRALNRDVVLRTRTQHSEPMPSALLAKLLLQQLQQKRTESAQEKNNILNFHSCDRGCLQVALLHCNAFWKQETFYELALSDQNARSVLS